jgi:hypothetical protein
MLPISHGANHQYWAMEVTVTIAILKRYRLLSRQTLSCINKGVY